MASEGSDPNAEYALSRLLQRGTVAEYQNEFEMLMCRVTGKSNSLLASIYIGGLKPVLQCALLWSNPTTLGEAFSLARIDEARFANQGPTTTNATPNIKPPTSLILTIGGFQNKASDSPTTPEVAHEVAPEIPSKALRETTTTVDTVAKIEETGGKSNDDGFKWGVQEASTFEELKHRLSTTPILSLPDFNEVFLIEADASANVIGTEPLEEPIAIHDWQLVLTAMQRRLWDPGIKSAFQDDTLRARWFRRSEECYASV
ncbi:reverse transcriptase [Tanacetum coccineum]